MTEGPLSRAEDVPGWAGAPAPPRVVDLAPAPADLLAQALDGLGARPKRLPSALLWDEAGSHLFDAICATPEYHPFPSELALLEAHGGEIARLAGPGCALLDYGAGCGVKTRRLLAALDLPAACVAIDIARAPLLAACTHLAHEYPRLAVVAVHADYTAPLALPDVPGRRLGYFPGSTIGNFTPVQAVAFLSAVRSALTPGGALLIGVDHTADPERLARAYDDAEGITAAFDRNALVRLVREFGAEADPDAFIHRAVFRTWHRRVEMRLVSRRAQAITLAGRRFPLAAGEPIVTEFCYKHRPETFAAIAAAADWRIGRTWMSSESGFALHWLEQE